MKLCNSCFFPNSNESFHALFGHSHQIIAFNDGKGLGQQQEGPLEAKQHFARNYKTFLSRKVDMDKCLTGLQDNSSFCSSTYKLVWVVG